MFLKKEINKLNKFLFICGLMVGFGFYSLANAQVASTLTVKYLDDFPGSVEFDSKYQEIDKYLVYKYVNFSFKKVVSVNSVGLSFVVDNNWYNGNKIEDVLFFKFDNGNWSRINYNSKSVDGGYKKYQVKTNSVGQYWAIVGVLPEKKSLSNTREKNNIQYGESINSMGYVKVIENIIDIGSEMLVVLKEPVKVKGASTIATTTATVSIVTLLAFLNGPASLWIVLQQMGIAFLGLLFSKKKHRSGVVYDANTGAPVPLVRVDLIDKKSNRIKATRFTDKSGEYYFLAPKGGYYLELRKKGYEIVENSKTYLLKALLHESDVELEVGLNEAGVIKKNIAILQEEHISRGRGKVFLAITMKYLANIVFFVGIVVSLWSCYINPTLFNFFVLGIYLLIVTFKGFFAKSSKYGTIVNVNNRPEPFASINVLDAKTKKLISRVISDTKGRYYILLEKGDYILNIKTVKGVSVNRRINVKNKNILSQKLIIQK